jgi:hypothetical protein
MRDSTSRRAGWLSIALLAAAVVGAGAASAQPERVTQSVNGTREDQAPARTYAAPYFAVHPDDPDIIMAASAEATSRQCRVLRSTNAGQTWTLLEPVPSPPAYPWCFHTIGVSNLSPLAFGSDGVLYMAFNGYGPDDGGDRDGRTSVFLGRSAYLGETWETTTVRDARSRAEPPGQRTGRGPQRSPGRGVRGLAPLRRPAAAAAEAQRGRVDGRRAHFRAPHQRARLLPDPAGGRREHADDRPRHRQPRSGGRPGRNGLRGVPDPRAKLHDGVAVE